MHMTIEFQAGNLAWMQIMTKPPTHICTSQWLNFRPPQIINLPVHKIKIKTPQK